MQLLNFVPMKQTRIEVYQCIIQKIIQIAVLLITVVATGMAADARMMADIGMTMDAGITVDAEWLWMLRMLLPLPHC